MNRNRLFILLALFFSVFLVCAGLLQLRSGLAPQKGGGVVDQLNGSLMWITSVLALLIAAGRPKPSWKFLFWLCVSAGFAGLAIDEAFEFHEGTKNSLGDDDYIKMAFWACAVIGVYVICRVAKPSRPAVTALLFAIGFQTLWLLSDVGDGDFFTTPIPAATLYWLEEYFEMLGSVSYLIGFLMHYHDDVVPALAQPAQPRVDVAAAPISRRAKHATKPKSVASGVH